MKVGPLAAPLDQRVPCGPPGPIARVPGREVLEGGEGGGGGLKGGWRGGVRPDPPPLLLPLSAQISATTKRGCRPWAGSPWGPRNRGADLLLPLRPPNRNGARPKAGPPPPSMPSHPHCRPTHGDRGPSPRGKRRRTTSMLGSGTHMVNQQVVLLSQTSEHHEPLNGQVDPTTTLPPAPPACAPDGRGARSRRPQGLKSGGCEGLTA